MLHHRRKLDRKGACEFADGHGPLLLETSQDCPARRINERCECPVELRSLKLRHVVKYGNGRRVCQERQPGSRCHGKRSRHLLGSFGPTTISVPRARLSKPDGTSQEWRSATLP